MTYYQLVVELLVLLFVNSTIEMGVGITFLCPRMRLNDGRLG